MGEGFSPAEKIVAQENKDKRDRGLEEAKVYRIFLDKLNYNIMTLIVGKIGSQGFVDLRKTKEGQKTLKDLGFLPEDIMKQVFKAVGETNDETKAKLNPYTILPDQGDGMINMTSEEIVEYIQKLSKSLKD